MLDIYKYHNNPDIVHGGEHRNSHQYQRLLLTPEDALDLLYDRDFQHISEKELVDMVCTDGKFSYEYAANILVGPFPAGEQAISIDPKSSMLYAWQAIKKPFPKGEPAIATNAEFSVQYVERVLHKPFKLAEPLIAKDPELLAEYNQLLAKYGYPPIQKE